VARQMRVLLERAGRHRGKFVVRAFLFQRQQRICAPRKSCSQQMISRKSTTSYRPVPRQALAIR
jgi:hypothetical protein